MHLAGIYTFVFWPMEQKWSDLGMFLFRLTIKQ